MRLLFVDEDLATFIMHRVVAEERQGRSAPPILVQGAAYRVATDPEDVLANPAVSLMTLLLNPRDDLAPALRVDGEPFIGQIARVRGRVLSVTKREGVPAQLRLAASVERPAVCLEVTGKTFGLNVGELRGSEIDAIGILTSLKFMRVSVAAAMLRLPKIITTGLEDSKPDQGDSDHEG